MSEIGHPIREHEIELEPAIQPIEPEPQKEPQKEPVPEKEVVPV